MLQEFNLNFSACVKVEFVLTFLIVFFTIVQEHVIISFCFALSFIILMLYLLLQIKKPMSFKVLTLVILALINVVINALLSNGWSFEFDYFKKVIMFVNFVMLLYFSYRDKVLESTYKLLIYIVTLTSFMLVLSYLFFGNIVTYAGGITLGFNNSNFTGMWLLHMAVYVSLLIMHLKYRTLLKSLLTMLFIILVYLIILTKARSCMLGIIVFILLCLLDKLELQKILMKKYFVGLIVLAPAIIVGIYKYLLSSTWFMQLFSFLVSAGKGLDSRLIVWNPAIEAFRDNIWLGDYFGISNGTGMSQLHNTHLDVLCSYGIIPFVLFVYILYFICCKSRKNDYFNRCALYGFFSVVIMGSFEAAVVAGAMGMNILTAGLILLANWDRGEQSKCD